jgi:hypothetical protein
LVTLYSPTVLTFTVCKCSGGTFHMATFSARHPITTMRRFVGRLTFTIKYPLLAAMLEPNRRKFLPRVTIEQRVKFAILCAKAVYKEEAFNLWADRWLSAEDRTKEAAESAVAATGSAGLTFDMMCNPEVMKQKAAKGSAGSAAYTAIWAAEGGTWVVGASAAEAAGLAANAGLSVESGKRLAEQAVA